MKMKKSYAAAFAAAMVLTAGFSAQAAKTFNQDVDINGSLTVGTNEHYGQDGHDGEPEAGMSVNNKGEIHSAGIWNNNGTFGADGNGNVLMQNGTVKDGLTVEGGATINGGTTMNGGATVNGGLTADTISAMDGHFKADEEGIHFRTEDAVDLPTDHEQHPTYHYYFDMNNEKGISCGHSKGASMSLNENGVTFAYGDKTTHINGDEIFTGTVHAGLVQATDMYIGNANNPDNQVVTKGELDKTIEGVTNSSVQWDDPQSKDSINDVGLKDGKITAENGGNIGGVEFGGNGTINAADGNFTVDENGNTGIGGNLDVAGDLTIKDGQGGYINVGDSITSIKDSIADVNGDISKVKADVAQNKEDISGIKDQIGSETLKTTSQTLTGAINENHNAIQTNKEAIGDVSALKGQDANGNKYTNLTDAVNGNYDAIQQTQTQVQQNTNAISSLSSQVNDLGGEIDNVGAISAALAGLHPLDYDGTGSKFQLAAAMGSYDGSQAAAIGGFYHFNEDVMMSVGGATAFDGDKKTAFNVGVSFRVGQGSSGKKVNSDDVLAQLNAMNEKIAALEAENQQLSEKVAALEGGEGAEAAEAE